MRNQPPPRNHGAGLRRIGVPGEHLGAAHPQLARRSGGAAGARLDVRHPELDRADGAPVGVAGLLERVVVGARGDRRRLGRAVRALDAAVERARGVLHEGRCHRGAAAGHQTYRRHVGARPLAQGAGHGDEEGRRARQEGDALARHQFQCLLGVEAPNEDRAQAGGARHQDPVEQPRDVGHRRRHQHRIGRAEAVHPCHQRGLPAQAALCVQDGFGDPGRARGEQDQGDVGRLAGKGAGRHRGAADRVGERGGVGERLGSELQDQGGVDLAEGRFHVGGAEGVQDGRRHGTDAPAGPGQDGGRQAVGDLPRHGLAAPDTALPEAARDHGHERIGLGRREPRGTVDHLAAVRGEQGVQGGHVPGAAGPAVAAGLLGNPGRSEAGRHGRAPYPGAGNVTPMSAWWREPAWISR